MDFINKQSGILYHVTNEALIPQYEQSESFEKFEKAEKKTESKKSTKK